MLLIMIYRYWQYAVIAILTIMLAITSFCLQDSNREMQLIKVTHDLETANNVAETSLKLAEIMRLNNERWQNAVNQNAQTQKQIAHESATNSAIVDSLSDTIDKNSTAYLKADADARAEYTAALANVSKDCIGQITELSRVADGHVADIRMMQQAWPKN
jgi:hypothetical protein